MHHQRDAQSPVPVIAVCNDKSHQETIQSLNGMNVVNTKQGCCYHDCDGSSFYMPVQEVEDKVPEDYLFNKRSCKAVHHDENGD